MAIRTCSRWSRVPLGSPSRPRRSSRRFACGVRTASSRSERRRSSPSSARSSRASRCSTTSACRGCLVRPSRHWPTSRRSVPPSRVARSRPASRNHAAWTPARCSRPGRARRSFPNTCVPNGPCSSSHRLSPRNRSQRPRRPRSSRSIRDSRRSLVKTAPGQLVACDGDHCVVRDPPPRSATVRRD
jgi:hypothetical protein